MNPLKNLTFGGTLLGENLEFAGTADDVYAGTDYRAWKFRSSKAARKEHICIVLHTDQTETIEQLNQTISEQSRRIMNTEGQLARYKRELAEATGKNEA